MNPNMVNRMNDKLQAIALNYEYFLVWWMYVADVRVRVCVCECVCGVCVCVCVCVCVKSVAVIECYVPY